MKLDYVDQFEDSIMKPVEKLGVLAKNIPNIFHSCKKCKEG